MMRWCISWTLCNIGVLSMVHGALTARRVVLTHCTSGVGFRKEGQRGC